MKLTVTTMVFVGAVASATLAAGKRSDLPPSGIVYSTQDLSRIEFHCLFLDHNEKIVLNPTFTIRCDFTQTMLSVPEPKEAASKVAKATADFEEGWQEGLHTGKVSPSEYAKLCRDPKQAKYQESERRRLGKNDHAALLLPSLEDEQGFFTAVCACKDTKCLHDILKEWSERAAKADADTCSIFSNHYEVDFQKQGDSWVNVKSPAGICYSSTTTSLTADKESPDFSFWNMRTVSVPAPEANPTICVNKIIDRTDAWRMYPWITLPCRKIKL
jgi:hypothetical protein